MRSSSSAAKALAFLRRKAIVSGLLGGSRAWLFYGTAAWLLRLLRRAFSSSNSNPKYSEELRAGERLLISREASRARAKRHSEGSSAQQKSHGVKVKRKVEGS